MSDVHERIRDWWDADAEHYDRSPGHALSDPVEAAAWRAALREVLPEAPGRILDAGAGTGALSLLAAERKAKERGLELEIVIGPVNEPPAGPFEVVIERHVIWTVPDPVGALRAWREVAAERGRLVLFEGIWAPADPLGRAKAFAGERLRSLRGEADHHHSSYPGDVLAQLPLAEMTSPLPIVEAVREAGWRGLRIKRLRDVEWAARLHEPWPLGWLEQRQRYVLIADA